MRILSYLALFLLSTLLFLSKAQKDLPVVSNFVVEKYVGHWYLISSIPKPFDFYCICSETNYVLDPSNSSIVNFDEYCRVSNTWAPLVHSRSYAEIDPNNNAQWTNVNTIIGSVKARADYFIFDLDVNYQWAVVGARNRESLYVFSREKIMKNDVYEEILERSTSLGFDVSKLQKNKQICNAAF